MSILGNPIASSIVAGMVQAPQAVRAKQQQDGQPQHEIRKVRETFESHMQALNESDSSDSVTHLHVDAQLPEHQSPDGKKSRKRGHRPSTGEPDANGANSQASGKSDPPPDDSLYRHLDVVI